MRRVLFVAVLAVFCWLGFGTHDASWANQEPAAKQAGQRAQSDKVRVLEPGTKLTVHLLDGAKLEGVLREVHDKTIVVEQKSGQSATIAIADIDRLQSKGGGLHPAAKVLIIVGATLGALLVIAVAAC